MNKQMHASLSDYLNQSYTCKCGHIHTTTLKHVEISEHAHYKLPDLLNEYNYKKIFVISDINTHKAAGYEISTLLRLNNFTVNEYIFSDNSLIPDEKAIGCLITSLPEDTDLIISVGSGTLCDLGKYISHKLKLPFYIVATAPSMDGFASNVSCLIINHMKTTVITHIPEAIIADINVLAASPSKMIAAGVGDIFGKYICLLDWKISNIVTDEYYCEFVESIVRNSIYSITNNIDKLSKLEPEAVKNVMEGLILSGIAMSYVGNSRPASGSEHHLSHYWELNFLENNIPPVLHGIKVGIGTIESMRLYDLLLNTVDENGFPNFKHARNYISSFSYESWEEQIKKVYKSSSEEVIKLEEIHQKNTPEHVNNRLVTIEKKWPDIFVAIKAYLPNINQLIFMLKSIGAPTKPYEEHICPNLLHDSIIYAKELRNRYGLLQLLFDLGCLEQFAEQERTVCV